MIRVHGKMVKDGGKVMIHLRPDYAFAEKVKALPSRKWVPKKRVWEARLIRSNAKRMIDWVTEGHMQCDDIMKRELMEKAFPTKEEKRKWPPEFQYKTQPMSKQKDAEEFIYGEDFWALFAEMGCGKSKMVIDVAAQHIADGRIDGLVVVSRVSIRENWIGEMEKHCPIPDVDCLVLESKKSKTKKIQYLKSPFMVSVGVESLSGKLGGGQVFDALRDLVSRRRCMFVIDESHYIKGHKSNRTKNVDELGQYCPIRGIMTGTPVPKNILDLYAPFAFLDPDILGFPSFWSFKLHHAILGGFGGKQVLAFRDVEGIMNKTNPHTYRMYRDDVVDLPPLTRKPIVIHQTKPMREAYLSMKRDRELSLEGKEVVPAAEMVAVYTKLRALSSGYVMDDEKVVHWVEPPEKTPKIKSLIEILDGAEEKAIIWVNTHAEIGAVKGALGDRVVEYHGKITPTQREENLRQFRADPDLSIVATVPSMQTGLTLTEAKLEVFFSLPLSYTDFIQAEARAYRIGQDSKVMVLMMVTENTVDMDIFAALLEKKDVHDYVMERPFAERFITAKPELDPISPDVIESGNRGEKQ